MMKKKFFLKKNTYERKKTEYRVISFVAVDADSKSFIVIFQSTFVI